MHLIHPRDSYSSPLEVYNEALRRGMDFVAITDHDSIAGAMELLSSPTVDENKVIVGEELETAFPETGQWIHINVLNLNESDHDELHRLSADVRDVCGYCRQKELLCILNHPFQSYRGQKPLRAYAEDVVGLFSHVEGLNGAVPKLQNRAVSVLCQAAERGGTQLVQVGGSDAHTMRRVGSTFTVAKGGSARAFLDEIKAGRCGMGGGVISTFGLAREVYGIVGRYYSRLYFGKGESQPLLSYLVGAGVATACLPAVFAQLPLAIVAVNEARQKRVSRKFISDLKDARLNLNPPPDQGPRAACPAADRRRGLR